MCSKEEGHLPYNVCTVYFYKGFEKLWGQIVREGWHFAVSARNIIRVSALSRACSSCDRLSCGQILGCRSKCGLMESLQELPTGSFWKFSSQGPISGIVFFYSQFHHSCTCKQSCGRWGRISEEDSDPAFGKADEHPLQWHWPFES